MIAGVGSRPEWRHRELVLSLGEGTYRFRTLSLYDVWCVWPHLAALYESIARGKALTFTARVSALLDHMCPGIIRSRDFAKNFKASHVDALTEFYQAQDWARIKALGERVGDTSPAAPPITAEVAESGEAQKNFYLICLAGARAANMSVIEFVEQRFEFCADAIVAMRDELARKQEEVDFPAAVMGAGLPVESYGGDEELMPAWVREIQSKVKSVQ